MDVRKTVSYISSIVVFAATAFIAIRVLLLDTSGAGITNGEFIPLRNAMFLIGVPCLVKFYVSSDKSYRENTKWRLGYGICFVCWIAFLAYALISPYFRFIRTMCIASFVLMAAVTYLEYSITGEKDK